MAENATVVARFKIVTAWIGLKPAIAHFVHTWRSVKLKMDFKINIGALKKKIENVKKESAELGEVINPFLEKF